MFDIRRPAAKNKKQISVIRTATATELRNYEMLKLVKGREPENNVKITNVVNQRFHFIPPNQLDKNKLGNLAFKQSISPADVSVDELFFIKCELDESALLK